MRLINPLMMCLCLAGITSAQGTFDVIQHQILNQNCVSCHTSGSSFATQSGLSLNEGLAYDQLVNVAPKNAAANADGLVRVSTEGGAPGLFKSFFWEKVNAPNQQHYFDEHPEYGALMPLGNQPLTNGELAFIEEWILKGAPQTGIVADESLLLDTTRYERPEFQPLDPPEQGIQFHLGPFDVWPSEHDREFLYYEPYETTEDLFVDRYEISYREGSHHFILYNYEAGERTPRPNVYRDARNQNGTVNIGPSFELARLFPFKFFVGSQSPVTDYSLPEGVAIRLPAGSGFDLNSHSVNRSDEVRQGEVYVNLHTTDRENVRHVANYDNFGNTDISLPPNKVTTISSEFEFEEARQIIQLWSHSHEHTVEFRIEGVTGRYAGDLLYWTNDWEHPPLLTLDDDPLLFNAGDRIRLVTTYHNWTDEEINFGLQSSDEMQFMFYVYTTDLFPAGDANGDYNVDEADLAIWRENMFKEGTEWAQADFNYDGVTDVADFNIWNQNRTSATAATQVPEPSTVTLALTCLLAIASIRHGCTPKS